MAKMTRTVGPKGQVVIPKELRERTGMVEGTEVLVELRGDEVVLRRSIPPGRYSDYFIRTTKPKLTLEVDLEKILEEQYVESAGMR